MIRYLALTVVLLIGGGAMMVQRTSRGSSGKEGSERPEQLVPVTVSSLGRLEPGDGSIGIGAPPGERVGRIEVKQGEAIKAGQPLVYLQSYEERKLARDHVAARLELARQTLAADSISQKKRIEQARLSLERVKSLGKLEIEGNECRLKLAEELNRVASRELERARSLRANSALSKSEFDQIELTAIEQECRVSETKVELERCREQHRLGILQAQADLDTARADWEKIEKSAPIASLESELSWSDERLRQAVLCSPISGRVLRIAIFPGERTDDRAILTVGETEKMMAVAEVYESDVRHIQQGCSATVFSPALAETLRGEVVAIGSMIFKNDVLDLDPMADTDSRVVEVRILLDDPDVAASLVNLQVDVTIFLREQNGEAPSNLPEAVPASSPSVVQAQPTLPR